MNKKESWILECLEIDLQDDNICSLKNFINEHESYVLNPKRSKDFSKKFNEIYDNLEWGTISTENSDYYAQENRLSDDPEIRG